MQNVMLDLTGHETLKLLRHRRKELQLSETEHKEVINDIARALSLAYDQFLQVASPGRIIQFNREPYMFSDFLPWLKKVKRIPEEKIEALELAHDQTGEPGKAYLITNP